jgi:uncharacterized membrane protein YphA (DoxX/SURF4 family)
VKAQAEMHVLAHQLELDYPNSNKNQDAVVYPATLVPGPYRGYVSAFTGLLLAVFALVLLIACVNAASLLLARASGRVREMAIRSALGAGRGRLIRQMLVESLLLSSIAGIAGVMLAWWMSRLLLERKPASLPITLEVPLDWRVLLFTLLVSLATGVIFGLVPGVRSARVNAAPILKEETQSAGLRKSHLRSLLLIGEIAACVVLLAGATLCVRSLIHSNSIDPGFDGPGRPGNKASCCRLRLSGVYSGSARSQNRIPDLSESEEGEMNNVRNIYNIVFLIGRIIGGGYFVMNAFNHFTKFGMMSGYAKSKGTPAPGLAVGGTGVLLLLGGASLLLGYHPTAGAIILVIFLLGVSFFMHNFWAVQEPQAKMMEMVLFMKNMGLLGLVLMTVAIPRPWRMSLGHW